MPAAKGIARLRTALGVVAMTQTGRRARTRIGSGWLSGRRPMTGGPAHEAHETTPLGRSRLA
ncbi:MAG: hypothetical protein MZU84_03190 [Sphingobacterium sp.]|nr:hypothetical protein [Sphingobacterium sp.]